MGSSSGEDYGELDDEEMLIVATHAEHRDITPPASKRRRLNNAVEGTDTLGKRDRRHGPQTVKASQSPCRSSPVEEEDDDKVHSRPRSVRINSARALTGRVRPIDDKTDNDEDIIKASVGLAHTGPRRSAEADNATDTHKTKSKSKYRIHIPKQAVVPKDEFLTQPPPPSSSPYRIRGAIWQKPKKVPTAAEPRRTSVEREDKINHSPRERRSPSRASSPAEEDAFDPSPHPIRAGAIALDEVAGFPSDAFSSGNDAIFVSSQERLSQVRQSQRTVLPRTTATQTNLRQTTLFGATARNAPASQSAARHNWPLAKKEEPPTHHKLDREAMNTWVYPTNLGTIRDYQFNIVQRGLYHNLLVALPTGLGKTFIAATIMLNWFRWTTESQIIFVAPTKPLVSQQVEACFNIAGIPRSATTMLTGETAARLRSEEYLTKRVFFMTPQTLMNDLANGNCDPKKIVLLVVDEAHRATGNYSYVEVVRLLRRFNKSFRVLALTATPGASVEAVQAVIDGLDISRVEIRTESSLDIRQYVHSRRIDTQVFDYSEEMEMLMGLWQRSLQPVLNKLNGMNAYWQKDPVALTPYGLTKARQVWMSTAGKNANMGVKGMVNAIFTILSSRAHATDLLKFHGIGPFYQNLLAFRDTTEAGEKGGKYRREITGSEHFQKLMSLMQGWVSNPEFVGHPKLEYLRTVVLNHFLDANEGANVANVANGEQSSTRIMVFVHYRDSAEEVTKVLKRHAPMIRPHVFVGQTTAKGSEGMDQKKQLDIIDKFKKGIYNTIVATSIGEEGLDIGEVDLIVCYDSSASPIRMLQRMGRTGRKRAGNIVVLLMRGKEENSFAQAKDNYEKMQHMIAEGSRFTFHEDRSMRIVPRDIQPVVDKKVIEIPLENTQPGLPEPGRKKQARRSKKPAKKFHMPDGVRTGFVKASRLSGRNLDSQADSGEDGELGSSIPKVREPSPEPEPIPSLEEVLLSATEERQLVRTYLDIGGDTPQMVETPRVDAFPALQRTLRPTKHLTHGRTTRRAVDMLEAMHAVDLEQVKRFERNLDPDDCTDPGSSAKSADLPKRVASAESPFKRTSVPAARRPKPPRKRSVNLTSSEDTNDDLSGFVVHSSPEGAVQGALSSVTSSPPSLDAPEKPFYTPLGKEYGANTDSDEELPEFSNLVGKITVAQSPGRVSSQRRGARRVVQDDSDDE